LFYNENDSAAGFGAGGTDPFVKFDSSVSLPLVASDFILVD
jgi:hypothetical protein